MRRRLLMVGRTRYDLPLSETLAPKFDALEHELDVRVLATAGRVTDRDERFRLYRPLPLGKLEGAAFYALLPFRVAEELRSNPADAVLVQGAQETALVLAARALTRSRAKVILDLHGDWRAATRLYGAPLRRVFAPFGDLLSRMAVRQADGVRTISAYTTGLVRSEGVEPAAEFPAFMDLEPFVAEQPASLPSEPRALFVGVLERYKAIDVLAAAWPLVLARLPGAALRIVGRGTMTETVESLLEAFPESVSWAPSVPADAISAELDAATVLVLPSRSEGLGRVVVEAFCRGRGVVGSRVGGIPDLVTDGQTGLLVPPENATALGEALVRALGEDGLAAGFGAVARAAIEPWLATPADYARRMRDLVEEVVNA